MKPPSLPRMTSLSLSSAMVTNVYLRVSKSSPVIKVSSTKKFSSRRALWMPIENWRTRWIRCRTSWMRASSLRTFQLTSYIAFRWRPGTLALRRTCSRDAGSTLCSASNRETMERSTHIDGSSKVSANILSLKWRFFSILERALITMLYRSFTTSWESIPKPVVFAVRSRSIFKTLQIHPS